MNTIPTTSKNPRIPYTIVGGKKSDKKLSLSPVLSLLVLNRGGRPYKAEYLKHLESLGDVEIMSVQGPATTYDVESLSIRFPQVKFLILGKKASPGEQINIGIMEATGRNVMVFWDDMRPGYRFTDRFLNQMDKSEELCSVPILQSTKYETVPSLIAPSFYGSRLKIISLMPSSNGAATLYPFDYSGIYNKGKFLLSGGFDINIGNQYWQKMDFGFRIHMWGESIIFNTGIKIEYLIDQLPEDTTPDKDYKMFYLKNLILRFSDDNASISWRKFLTYSFKSGSSFISSIKEFKSAIKWVEINKFRFICDARQVTDLWEVRES
jgi:hypothetical protein